MRRVKVVAISDTHNMLDRVAVPDGDILIHAGDATMTGSPDEIIKFNTDLKRLPHPLKVFIPGNHDRLFEQDSRYARQLLSAATVLIDEETTMEGLRIYGSPWQPGFGYGWAFQLPKNDPEQSERRWLGITEGLDILVTHGPPRDVLDGVPYATRSTTAWLNNMEYPQAGTKYRHVGCPYLLNRIKAVKPKIHIFGHIHEAYGQAEEDSVRYYNAAICDGNYKLANKPHVIEVEVNA